VLAYAGNGLPPTGTVPEPASLTLPGAGIGGLGLVRRKRAQNALSAGQSKLGGARRLS